MSKQITVELTDEQYAFIKQTAHELETQDNRHTATPIFRIYEDTKVEKRDGCGDHTERLDYEGAEEHYCKPCQKILADTDGDYEKLPELGAADCFCDVIDEAHWTYDIELLPASGGYDGVAFLTERAAEEYRKANHYHFNNGGVVYAESAFRNWELQEIIAIIKAMGGKL